MKTPEELEGLILRAEQARRDARSLCQAILREYIGRTIPPVFESLAKRCEEIGYGNKVPVLTE